MDSAFLPQSISATLYTLRLCRVKICLSLFRVICTPVLTTSSLAVFTLIYSPFDVSPPASPPRSVILDCHHVSIIDYSVISEIRDLLRQFRLRKVRLFFARLQVRLSALSASQTFIGEYRLLGIFLQIITFLSSLPPTFSPLF